MIMLVLVVVMVMVMVMVIVMVMVMVMVMALVVMLAIIIIVLLQVLALQLLIYSPLAELSFELRGVRPWLRITQSPMLRGADGDSCRNSTRYLCTS